MKRIVALAFIASAVLASAAHAVTIDPIPGSLTYPEPPKPTPPKVRLDNQPTGSIVHHEFRRDGYEYHETYIVEPDRSATITRRHQSRPGGFNRRNLATELLP
jgi:hypothetical protein